MTVVPDTVEILALADHLYALPPGEFTAARDALVREHRADKPFATAVKRLAKPSMAAYVMNLLVRREHDQVIQILDVGAALRDAADSLDGEELRALTRQRRQLTAAVTQVARATAADEGVKVSQAVAEQVEGTLTAAMLDANAATAVRSGLLITAMRAAGPGELDVGGAVALPEALGFQAPARAVQPRPRPALSVVPNHDPEPDRAAIEAAQQALSQARTAAARAGKLADKARARVRKLQAASLQAQAELAELRARLADLEERAESTSDELDEAESAAEEAATERTEADARVLAAEKALADVQQ